MRVTPGIVLTDEEQVELLKLAHSQLSSVRLVQRARIVLLAADGMQRKDIALQLDMERVQISRWHERYANLCLAGIERGRPDFPR